MLLELIQINCINSTGTSNSYIQGDNKYFYQIGRENRDGSITGTIWKFLENDQAKKTGSFKIEPNGTVSLGPKFFKNIKLLKVQLKIDNFTKLSEVWRPEFGPPTQENLAKFVQTYVDSFKKGGVNQHIGEIDNPTYAAIYDIHDNIVISWKQNANNFVISWKQNANNS